MLILDSYFQDDFDSLVKAYEALVKRPFNGKYYGLELGDNISTYFGVFIVEKVQPTDDAKQFYTDICKLIDAKRVNILIKS